MMTSKIGYGVLNEIKELKLDYMEHNYMRIKSQKIGHGTSRNLMVIVNSQMMLFDMVKRVKGNLISLELVHFHIHSSMLTTDQINSTEHHSLSIS